MQKHPESVTTSAQLHTLDECIRECDKWYQQANTEEMRIFVMSLMVWLGYAKGAKERLNE